MDRPVSGSTLASQASSLSAQSHGSLGSAPLHQHARISVASRLPLSTLPSSRPMRLTRSAASRVPGSSTAGDTSVGSTSLGSTCVGDASLDSTRVGDVSQDSLRSNASSRTRALLYALDESFGAERPSRSPQTSSATTTSSVSPQHSRRASGESVRGKRISRPFYVGASNGCEPDWLAESEREGMRPESRCASPFWTADTSSTTGSGTLGRIASLRRSVRLSRAEAPPPQPSCLPLDADPFARPTSAMSMLSSEHAASGRGSAMSTHSAVGAQLLLNQLPSSSAPRPRLLSATAELLEPSGLCTPPRDAPRSAHSPHGEAAQQPAAQRLASRFSQSPASRGRGAGVDALRKLARMRKGSTQVPRKGSLAPAADSSGGSLAVPGASPPRRGALSGGLRTMRSAASIGNLRKLLPKSSRVQLAPPLPAPYDGADETSPRPSGSLRWPRRRQPSTATVVSGSGSAASASLASPVDADEAPASPVLRIDKALPATPSRRRRTSSAARTPGGRRRVISNARAIPVSPPRGSTRAAPAPRRLHLLANRALLPGNAPRQSVSIRDSWLDVSGSGIDAWALAAAPNGKALKEAPAARPAWWNRSLRIGRQKVAATDAEAHAATLPTLGMRRSEDMLRHTDRAPPVRASRSIDLLRTGNSSIHVRPAIPSWDMPVASDYGRSASARAQLNERRAAANRAMSASPPADAKPWLRPLRLGDANALDGGPRSAPLLQRDVRSATPTLGAPPPPPPRSQTPAVPALVQTAASPPGSLRAQSPLDSNAEMLLLPHSLPIPPRTRRSRASTVSSFDSQEVGTLGHERNDTVASVQTVSSSILDVADDALACAPPSGPPQEPLPTPPNSAALTIRGQCERGVTPLDWNNGESDHAGSRDTSSSLASEATEMLSSLLDSFGEASPARDDYLRPHWRDGDSTRRSSTTGDSILSYTSTVSSGASDGADLQSLIDGLMDESDDEEPSERGSSASSGFTWPPRPSRAPGQHLAAAPTPSIRLSPADGGETLDVGFDMVRGLPDTPSTQGLPDTPSTQESPPLHATPDTPLESPCPPSRVRTGGTGRSLRPRVSDLDLTKLQSRGDDRPQDGGSAPRSVPPAEPPLRAVDLHVGFAHVPPPSFSPELLNELGLGSVAPDTPCATPTHKRMMSAPLDLATLLDEYTPPQSVPRAQRGKGQRQHARTSSEPPYGPSAAISSTKDLQSEGESSLRSAASCGRDSAASSRDRDSMASSCGSGSLLSCGESPVIATARVVAGGISSAPAPASRARVVYPARQSQGVQCASTSPGHLASPVCEPFGPSRSAKFAFSPGEPSASLTFASPASSPASSTRRDSFWSLGEGNSTSMSSVWSDDGRWRSSGVGKLLPAAIAEEPDTSRSSMDSLSFDEAEALEQQLRFEEAALTEVLHSRQTWTGGGLSEYLMSVFQPPRELEQVGVFLVESRAHFRPLRKQRALDVRDVTEHDHLATPRRWRRLSHAAMRYLQRELQAGGGESETDESTDAEGELDESSLWDLSGLERCSTPQRSGTQAPPFRYVLVSPSTQSSATTRHSAAS